MTFVLAYINLVPHLVVANIVLVAIVAAIAKKTRAGRMITCVSIIGSVGWWVTFAIATGVEERVVVQMTWEIDPQRPPHRHLKHKHVVLYFKRSPHNFVGLYSNQVAEYLSRLPTNEVPVTFEVTKDFGRVRAFNEIQIGELKTWDGDHSYGYGGVSSHSDPSPWP